MQKVRLFIQKITANQKVLVRILLGISLAIYFLFAFHHLTKFISADEHYWLPNSGAARIEAYWHAVGEQKWKDTRINDKPGITLAYISGIALLFEKNPQDQIIYSKQQVIDIYNPTKTEEINFLYRLPLVLFTGFSALFFFWIIKRITKNDWIGLFSATGMLLSPILLGISQIVNPDTLFWIFGAATVFSFFAYLQKGSWKLAALASLFLGLSLASKYVSVIFFPFFFLMMLGYHFFEHANLNAGELALNAKNMLKNALAYVAIIAGGMLLFAILMPASFVEPKVFYEGTIGFPGMQPIFWLTMILNALVALDAFFNKGKYLNWLFEKCFLLRIYLPKIMYAVLAGSFLFVLLNWLSRHSLVDLSKIPFDTKQMDSFGELPFLKKYIMEFVALTFSLTPIALFLLIFLWIKGIFSQLKHSSFVFLLSAFFLVFYTAVVMQGLLVTVRYSIILFPFTMVLVAIAIEELLSMTKTKETLRVMTAYTLLVVPVLFLQAFSLIDQYFFGGTVREKIPNDLFLGILLSFLVIGLFLLKKTTVGEYFPWKLLQKITRARAYGIFLACNIFSILLISPFYFSYTNELLPKKYIISGAWGYGGYEAAQFLNKMPDAKNLTLWTDVYGVCEFFQGSCIHYAKVDLTKRKIDYYFRSLQATVNPRFETHMSKNPVWSMRIDNRPKSFIKLFKEEKPTNQ